MKTVATRSRVSTPMTWAMFRCSSMLLAPTKTYMPAKKTWIASAAR
jgi:hypothetical protein